MKSCPFCGEQVQDDAEVCEHCNADLAETDKVKKQCPYCNAPVSIFSEKCHSCGRTFDLTVDSLDASMFDPVADDRGVDDRSKPNLRRLLIISAIVVIVLCLCVAGFVAFLNILFPTG